MPLIMNVNDDQKIVEIWLTNAEKQDALVAEQLKPIYREYKEKKYLVAVFQSGGRDLCEATADLLCYNRKRFAQQVVARERKQEQNIAMST